MFSLTKKHTSCETVTALEDNLNKAKFYQQKYTGSLHRRVLIKTNFNSDDFQVQFDKYSEEGKNIFSILYQYHYYFIII